MNDKIKRFAFYNIFFLCTFLGLFMVLNLKSFAYYNSYSNLVTESDNGNGYGRTGTWTFGDSYPALESDTVFACIKLKVSGQSKYVLVAFSPSRNIFQNYVANWTGVKIGNWSGTFDEMYYSTFISNVSDDLGYLVYGYSFPITYFSTRFPMYDSLSDFIENWGNSNQMPFDETLKLDSFKVTSWQIGTFQATFKSKFQVTWSDPRIANVQVRIVGTANSPASFEANLSPFIQKFSASNYVMKNGDVIHLTATPFTSNGEYGESLYYSLIYDDNLPSNWYRKLVNTPYNDTTITIPYYNVSGQPESVTLPVDGITTNKVYKVNYNPVTYEYGDINIYDIYYTPVIVYPDDTPEEEIDETQDTIINDYTTNNYNTINNITNYEFNIDFGDISNNDIQDSYDDVGNFLNGFGSFIAKIVNFFGVLFPFFPAGVSIAIITAFGIVALLLIVALVIKIVSAIKNFIF